MTEPHLEYDALSRQLERMRHMQYAYFAKFFQWIMITAGVLLALFLQPFSLGHKALPFLVLTAGMQASFYLHFVDFARTHAAALEKRLNTLLGRPVLLGSHIEDLYFYPINAGKFSGFLPTHPLRFFSIYTTHWCGVWAFLYAAGVMRAWEDLGTYRTFYLVLLGTWTLGNVCYLAWFFGRRRDLNAVTQALTALE
jgi:hypothetical protein